MPQIDFLGNIAINPNTQTANQKGASWSQIVASTARAYSGIIISPRVSGDVALSLDVSTGASGSESSSIKVKDLMQSMPAPCFQSVYVPLSISASTRLSMRVQYSSNSSASGNGFAFHGIHDPTYFQGGLTSLETQNANLSGATSATVLPGNATADVEGAITEMVASTPSDAFGLLVMPLPVSVSANNIATIKIYTGAASSEVLLIDGIQTRNNNGSRAPIAPLPFFVPIAAGTRISGTITSSTNTATARDQAVAVALFLGTPTPSSSSSIILGGQMQRMLKDGETTAGRKRVFFDLRGSDGAGWTGSVTGLKAQLSTNGGSETASTNDIVRVASALHYVELSDAEAAASAPGDVIAARVAASGTTRLEGIGFLEVSAFDPTATEVPSNVTKMNGVTVIGAGTSGDKWRA